MIALFDNIVASWYTYLQNSYRMLMHVMTLFINLLYTTTSQPQLSSSLMSAEKSTFQITSRIKLLFYDIYSYADDLVISGLGYFDGCNFLQIHSYIHIFECPLNEHTQSICNCVRKGQEDTNHRASKLIGTIAL